MFRIMQDFFMTLVCEYFTYLFNKVYKEYVNISHTVQWLLTILRVMANDSYAIDRDEM